MKAIFSLYIKFVKKSSEESQEHSWFSLFRDWELSLPINPGFSTTPTTGASKGAAGMRRAGTIIRSPIESRNKDKDKVPDGDLRASEVYQSD